jgi:peptide/nickel transport system substrate-binding protein
VRKKLIAFGLAAVLLVAMAAGGFAQSPRTGAWVDRVLITEIRDPAGAITRLEAGDIDMFFNGLAVPDLYRRVAGNPALTYSQSFGLTDEITFNVAGPVLPDGTLNPFHSARIREAMHWLVDRDRIVREHYGGLGVPRYLPIWTSFLDNARNIATVRALERRYAHNPTLARTVVTEEMRRLGAELVGDRWQFQGRPVRLIFLIRTEDARRLIGDYMAGLLEGLGFAVERRYGAGGELGPIWQGRPEDGQWHLVTAGWSATAVSRDEAATFSDFYTPRGWAIPLWQAYRPSPEFDAIADRLARRDFTTLEERSQLFAQALDHAMRFSPRAFTSERLAFIARRREVRVVTDLAAGVAGGFLWAHTLRFGDRVGGTVRAASTSILTQPWNPVAGTNWLFDMTPIRATSDWPTAPDPFTGLPWPQRLERAEVTNKRGLPVSRTHDWVSLDFADEIRVPADAWIDWDATAQRFITVGTKHPGGLTANSRVVIHYPRELFQTTWHDGSRFSIGDLVLRLIMQFDRANPASPIHDPAAVSAFRTFQGHFRGARIVSRDPLVIEWYTDQWFMDAESTASVSAWWMWPYYAQGPGPWHTVAMGIRAESERRLAFSMSRAAALRVEWMSMIAGPSLAVFRRSLPILAREFWVPYEPTMREFVPHEDAVRRWTNLVSWFNEKGHFWVGNGPFYLERAFPVEKVVQLDRYERFIDPAGKWDRFAAPALAAVTVTGPARVRPGAAANFDVRVTTDGRPYPMRDIQRVKFLLFDARGELALTGDATAVRDGAWRINLTPAQTTRLVLGTARLEAVAVSRLVARPGLGSMDVVIRR